MGGGGGQKLEKWPPKKIGALCAQNRNIKLRAAEIKIGYVSGISMFNLMLL